MAFAAGGAKSLAQTQPTPLVRQRPNSSPNPTASANPANSANTVNSATPANPPVLPGQYHDNFTLAEIGSPQFEMHSTDRMHNFNLTLPQTHVPRTAKIHMYYAFSPALMPQLSHLKLILNGTLFATIQPTPGKLGGSDSSDQEGEFDIPPELLVHNNTLTIEFIGHYTMSCEDPASTALWARVDRNTFSTSAAICCHWQMISRPCRCRS